MIDFLNNITQRLETLDIAYMISGSIALNIYTIPRMTRDVDVVILLEEKNVDLFLKAFESDFYHHKPSIIEEVRRKGMFNLIDTKTSFKIDFIVRKEQPYRIKEFERRIRTDVLGFDTWVVSQEDLIISKIIWIQELQSEKQMEDISHLLENDDVDMDYVHFWIKTLHLNTFNLLKNE